VKLHKRWQETRFGVFQRRTEHELFCWFELSEDEQAAYQRSDLGDRMVCEYSSRGVRLDTRLSSLVAGETRFGSEDRAYLEAIEQKIIAAAEELASELADGQAGSDDKAVHQ